MDMSLSKLWELVMDRGPGVLQSMGSQRVRHDLASEQQGKKGRPLLNSGGACGLAWAYSVQQFLDPLQRCFWIKSLLTKPRLKKFFLVRNSIKTGRKWEETAWPLPSCSPVSHQSLPRLQPEAALLQGQHSGSQGRVASQLTPVSALGPCAGCCLWPSLAVLTLLQGLQVYTFCFHILSLPRNVFCEFNIQQALLFRVWCKLFQIWIHVCCIYMYIRTYNFLRNMVS